MKKWTHPLLINNLAAIVLGAILTYAFAPYEIYPLAVIMLVGLVWLLLRTPKKHAFLLGFSFGLGLFGAGVYWVFISIHSIGGVPASLAAVITAGFVCILALFPGGVCYATQRYFPANTLAKIICVFPACWVLAEWIRGWIATGFPWLFLGYSQTNSPLKNYAPILGVYGISLAIVLSSTLFISAIINLKQKKYLNTYLSLFAILGIWILGNTLGLITWTHPAGPKKTVALVQGAIPQLLKWSPEHLQLSFDRYEQLSEPLWGKYDFIIWPEAAIPLPLAAAQDYIDKMEAKAITTNTTLILGIPIATTDKASYLNAIYFINKDGKNSYFKRRLVPFGEYTPLSVYFAPALAFLNIPMSEMSPGSLHQPPLTIDNVKILSSICYEIAFPDLMRSRDETVGMLLTLSNDAWFGKSNAQDQHFQMAQMRSIEFARPTIVVTNDGVTGIIGPNGNVQAKAPARIQTVLTGEVQPMSGQTLWMQTGANLALLLCICLLAIAYFNRSKKEIKFK